MTIILRGGPFDGQERDVPDNCIQFSDLGPRNIRYRPTGTADAQGRPIFEYYLPQPDEPGTDA